MQLPVCSCAPAPVCSLRVCLFASCLFECLSALSALSACVFVCVFVRVVVCVLARLTLASSVFLKRSDATMRSAARTTCGTPAYSMPIPAYTDSRSPVPTDADFPLMPTSRLGRFPLTPIPLRESRLRRESRSDLRVLRGDGVGDERDLRGPRRLRERLSGNVWG